MYFLKLESIYLYMIRIINLKITFANYEKRLQRKKNKG